MKTNLIAAALMTSADAQKLKGDVPATITMGDPEPEKANKDPGLPSFQTIDTIGPVPAALVCALVAE